MKPGWYRAGGKDRYYLGEDGAWSIDCQDGSEVQPLKNTTPAEMEKIASTGILVPEREGPPPDLAVFGTGIMPDPGYQHQGGNG